MSPRSSGARNDALGRYGEEVAARALVESGMVLIERRWRCSAGEIDLVLREGGVLVFCEVKTRVDAAHGHPLEAVTPVKAARLRRLAAMWLEQHDVHPRDVRIDVVGVLRPLRGPAVLEHVRGVG